MTGRYAQLMIDQPVHLILKLDTDQPIELGAFVRSFTAIGNEFERMVSQKMPSARGNVEFFVREVRSGCVEADIFPMIAGGTMFALSHAETLMLAEDFIRRWGRRITALVIGNREEQPESKAELADYLDAVRVVLADPDARSSLKAATFRDGIRDISAEFTFDAPQAQAALREIESRKAELDQKNGADRERVLMVFTRPDRGQVGIGKHSGEKVLIEEISENPLALTYGSALATERIKHEIIESDENVFRLGFIVDVNVQSVGGKPRAYSVTHVHQVIVLEDDD